MAALTPFSLGLKAGGFVRSLFEGSPDVLIIAHRIKGRRRYTCQALKGNPALCEAVTGALRDFPLISSVNVNPVTGSLTVTYSQEESVMDALFDTLSHELSGRHAQQEESFLPRSLIEMGENLNDSARRLKDGMASFLNHSEPVFVSRIAGLALIAYGVSRVLRGERPSGPQLFWWGVALLLRQTHRKFRTLNEGTVKASLFSRPDPLKGVKDNLQDNGKSR